MYFRSHYQIFPLNQARHCHPLAGKTIHLDHLSFASKSLWISKLKNAILIKNKRLKPKLQNYLTLIRFFKNPSCDDPQIEEQDPDQEQATEARGGKS